MLAPLFMIAALLVCGPALEEAQETLVRASIVDMSRHEPAIATAFRDVRLAIDEDPDGSQRNLICGEFRPSDPGDGAEWETFGSRETMSGREHLLGRMATVWCANPELRWEPDIDLSARYEGEIVGAR